MATLSLLAAVALAGVFLVSAIAKLADRDGTREAVAGFGVPERRTAVVARLLAPLELVIAAALVVSATRAAGFIGALLLLAGFTRAIAVALRAGHRPACHCFGRIGGADISVRTALRNTVLAALSGVGLLAGSGSTPDLRAGQVVTAVVGGLALAGVIIGVEGIAGRADRRRLERAATLTFEQGLSTDLSPAATIPDFTLPTIAGHDVSREDLLTSDGRPTLLMFLSPGCGSCKVLRSAALRWFEAYGDRLQVAVVAQGSLDANRDGYPEGTAMTVLLDADGAVGDAFGIASGPAAILLGPDGRLFEAVARGETLVRRLLLAALRGTESEPDDGPGLPTADAESITRDTVLRPRALVLMSPGEEGTILFDEGTGASVSLDGIGSVVWSVLDGTSPLGEIIDDLADAFATPHEVVERDTLDLARSLGRAGLFEGITPTEQLPTDARSADSERNAPGPALTPDHAHG